MSRRTAGPAIEWTEQATRQLDQAHDYIALSNSEEVAARITTLIVTTVQQLGAFPMSGRSGRASGTRELVISNTPFIAAYAIDHDRIVILAIFHGAQQWPEAF
jgi:toxin ParE1/3/4